MLEQAVQRTRQEKDLQAEMAAAVKHLEAAEKTARQKEQEATMTPEEQLAYEIAERIVESNAQNTTSVGEEVITRRSMLDKAAKTAKDDGNQAKSDKNVNWLNIVELHDSPFRTWEILWLCGGAVMFGGAEELFAGCGDRARIRHASEPARTRR